MKKSVVWTAWALAALAFTGACSQLFTLPTATPESTATPLPTNTARPTRTPTAVPELSLGGVQAVPEGGFSFQPIVGYETDIQGAGVGFSTQRARSSSRYTVSPPTRTTKPQMSSWMNS
jgi:hypothetical protein